MNSSFPHSIGRREALKWVMSAAALGLLDHSRLAADEAEAETAVFHPLKGGYGTDPDLSRTYHPGDLWPLTFTPAQQATAAALADVILPADDQGPAASTVGVVAMLDEWVSAPYPAQQSDRKVLLSGLAWLDTESQRLYSLNFADGVLTQKTAIVRTICDEKNAAAELKSAARFFRRFRSLAAGAYYTTKEGMKDIGYTGNVPLTSWDGPPAEIIRQLGLDQG